RSPAKPSHCSATSRRSTSRTCRATTTQRRTRSRTPRWTPADVALAGLRVDLPRLERLPEQWPRLPARCVGRSAADRDRRTVRRAELRAHAVGRGGRSHRLDAGNDRTRSSPAPPARAQPVDRVVLSARAGRIVGTQRAVLVACVRNGATGGATVRTL